ncbi:uncharacterized protein LOC123267312 [Cotesia glomerata]|uniref:uncharacterized protein LOC123267312 n=1 Tax=Cotesia glomerata TaxID=32391 RepID=UPI001D01814E|nr:uncharacterized protein LOC123267312 [Cotesia glomerata]
MNKGSDQATYSVNDENNEIEIFQSGRYISSSEAVWRILGFPIHERDPTVVHLAVHLENGQRVYFNNNTNIQHFAVSPPKTTLTEFFKLCSEDDFAKTLLYSEVPAYYTWRLHVFKRRKIGQNVPNYPEIKKSNALGRVYTVHPNNFECYSLRMLLHKIRGPTSFQSLKTVNNQIHESFQAACAALGLLENDDHWDQAIEEATIYKMPFHLRNLFVIILGFCHVTEPIQLWLKYRNAMSEDILHRFRRHNDNNQLDFNNEIYNEALILIEDQLFSISGKTLNEFNFTSPQRNVYEKILESVNENQGKLFFIDAPGGTEKTFLLNLLLAKVRSSGKIALAVASSGIAATLLTGGRTAHSLFKLPLNLNIDDSPICNISKQSEAAKVFKECSVIIWDECTMSHKRALETVNRTMIDIRNDKHDMGGMTLVLAGDFRQTLPVVKRGTRADEVNACLKSSFLWPKLNLLSLSKNMRAHLYSDVNAEEFSRLLLKIGNEEIEEENGEEIIYTSVDNVVEQDDVTNFPVEFLNSLNPAGMPHHNLKLKVAAPIMLMRNLNPPKLCNGTRLQVISLKKNVIEAKIITGTNDIVFIPRIPIICTDYEFQFKRIQFPVM